MADDDTLTMSMRNKMMDRWFAAKNNETQSLLLRHRNWGENSEKWSKRSQPRGGLLCSITINRWRNERLHIHWKDAITRQLQWHSGPCCTPADMGRLQQRFWIQQEKSAPQSQINYHKVVFERKSPLLKTSLLSVGGLADSSRQYLVSSLEHAATVVPLRVLEGDSASFCVHAYFEYVFLYMILGSRYFIIPNLVSKNMPESTKSTLL